MRPREEPESWRKAGKGWRGQLLCVARRDHRRRRQSSEYRRRLCVVHEAVAAERAAGVRGSTPEVPVKGAQPARAHLMDATEAAKSIGEVDLLYIDPPYNSRQYVAYYHIPEILARGWTDSAPAIRGKVGLLAGNEGRSQWSHGRRVQKLFFGAPFRHDRDTCPRQLQFRRAPATRGTHVPLDQGVNRRKSVPFQPAVPAVPGRQRAGGEGTIIATSLSSTSIWCGSGKLGCFHEAMFVWSA